MFERLNEEVADVLLIANGKLVLTLDDGKDEETTVWGGG